MSQTKSTLLSRISSIFLHFNSDFTYFCKLFTAKSLSSLIFHKIRSDSFSRFTQKSAVKNGTFPYNIVLLAFCFFIRRFLQRFNTFAKCNLNHLFHVRNRNNLHPRFNVLRNLFQVFFIFFRNNHGFNSAA